MKRMLLLGVITLLLASCGNNNGKTDSKTGSSPDTTKARSDSSTADPIITNERNNGINGAVSGDTLKKPGVGSQGAGAAGSSKKDPNSQESSGRTGDSTGTRSPN